MTTTSKAADVAICATKPALTDVAGRHGRIVYLVRPAHTTMDGAHCGAGAKHPARRFGYRTRLAYKAFSP
ncbi:hypothetical protein ABTZ93_38540 [Streptomyces sp. NPDC097941]|uniref:hypothetical protein n=1 Tax=Streptomyces sp. NPDC097941 TaxID=3155685 RepID=UPI00332D2C83